ncbi:hypothetical protein TWF718_003709 [Orbilia javanica]|uniref:F-box domain-containing protein n=1 Tax=Orbilia javanica TaxID=47235 RepID=A0AAN8N594_9PEZI
MTTLTDLPYDIKNCILRQVNERGALLTLISTSKTFYNVFMRHKEGILHRLYLSEALSYYPDSIIFTYCRRKIHAIDNFATLFDIIKGYRLFGQRGLPPNFLKPEIEGIDPRTRAHQLADDYCGIRKIALAHQYAVRAARHEPGLTPSELRRITLAIYRGWTLLLLLNKGLDLESELRVANPHPPADIEGYGDFGEYFDLKIERLIATWDIWDVLRVQSVMGESIRILPTGQVNMNDPGAFSQFEADIAKSGLKEIVERYSPDEKVVLVFPIYSMGKRLLEYGRYDPSRPQYKTMCNSDTRSINSRLIPLHYCIICTFNRIRPVPPHSP